MKVRPVGFVGRIFLEQVPFLSFLSFAYPPSIHRLGPLDWREKKSSRPTGSLLTILALQTCSNEMQCETVSAQQALQWASLERDSKFFFAMFFHHPLVRFEKQLLWVVINYVKHPKHWHGLNI